MAPSAVLAVAGCLDVLGPIDVDPTPKTEIRPNEPSAIDGGVCAEGEAATSGCRVRCRPGTPRCDGNLLEQCNAAGDAWDLTDQCASHELCNVKQKLCLMPACAARQHRCSETGELLICKADLTGFEHKEQCLTPAFCSAVAGREGCDGMACRAGRQRCNGPQIEQCRQDRSGFDKVGQPCASALLCVEGESELARCDPPTCEAGKFSCDGANLMRCADEANQVILIRQCTSAALCQADQQRCAEPCAVGEQRCTGSALERCNAAQTAFELVVTCAGPALCDPKAPACLTAPPVVVPPVMPPVLGNEPYTFVEAASTAVLGLGPMTLRLPSQWKDVDVRPWTSPAGVTLGPSLIASTDAARFAKSFDIPGVYFAATASAPVNVAARLADFDMSARCTRGTAESYDDGLYFGTTQTWNNCAGTNATNVVVVAMPGDEAFVTVVIVTMLAPRDDLARNEIWKSFEVQP